MAADAPRRRVSNDHIRQMIEQVLFTAPGERVNRPDFGCGLLQMVFAPNSGEVATATQFLVQGALQQALGDVIDLTNVAVSVSGSQLTVTVQYTVRNSQQQVVAQFTQRRRQFMIYSCCDDRRRRASWPRKASGTASTISSGDVSDEPSNHAAGLLSF